MKLLRTYSMNMMSGMFILAFVYPTGTCGQVPAQSLSSSISTSGNLERLLAARPVISQKLTLDQAVTIALRESPVLRGAHEEVEAAIGRLNAARAETRPWLSLNGFASGGSNPSIISSPSSSQPQMTMALPKGAYFDGNLMLMYPLYTGGRLAGMIRQASSLRNASQADFLTLRQEITLMTRIAYRETLAKQAIVGVAQARLAENKERLRVAQEKFNQGAIPVVAVRRDEAEVAAAQQEVTNAQRDVELSLVQLKTMMGINPSSQLELTGANDYQPSADFLKRLIGEITGQKETQTGTLPPDLTALLRLAERQRPELRAITQRVLGANAETAVARSASQPQVNLFAMGDVLKANGSNTFAGTTFGLTASLPLYNGGQQRARVQTAEAERRKQEQELNRLALQVVQEVNTAILNVRAAEQNIQTARQAQTSAQEGYRVALQRFDAGRSILVELLDALSARTQAESAVVQALFQYNVAQDQLLRAVGDPNSAS